MIFKLAQAAEKSWRRLNGHNQLPKIILGIKYTDGIEVVEFTELDPCIEGEAPRARIDCQIHKQAKMHRGPCVVVHYHL
jgi:hypothetical protein